MKKILSVLIVLAFLVALPAASFAAAGEVSVEFNGEKLSFDVPAQIYNGRTLVPLRAIFEKMGAEVDYADGVATATKGDTVVVLTIGDTSPTINGEVVTIDQSAIIVDGRTLAPLRFVAEAFGGSVLWDPDSSTASITYGAAEAKASDIMTHAEYLAADMDSKVVIETYVQDKQSWWDNKATLYTQDKDGAYFLYNIECSEADYAKLIQGTKIRVEGYKASWSGIIEIIDATFEIIDGSYIAPLRDVTALLADDSLIDYMNEAVMFKGLTVVAAGQDAAGKDLAFLYNWDGSGEEGTDADLYFNVSVDGNTYTFLVEYYLRNETTDVYKAVQALKVGDKVDLEGFLYWYNGPNPHITSVTVL